MRRVAHGIRVWTVSKARLFTRVPRGSRTRASVGKKPPRAGKLLTAGPCASDRGAPARRRRAFDRRKSGDEPPGATTREARRAAVAGDAPMSAAADIAHRTRDGPRGACSVARTRSQMISSAAYKWYDLCFAPLRRRRGVRKRKLRTQHASL